MQLCEKIHNIKNSWNEARRRVNARSGQKNEEIRGVDIAEYYCAIADA